MNFTFTDEQEEFRGHVAALAAKEFAPRQLADDRAEWFEPDPHDMSHRLAEVGLTGLHAPASHGGEGADCVTVGIAIEEVARAHFGAAALIMSPALFAGELFAHATAEQRDRWIPDLVSGDVIPALALTEADHGSDAANIRMRAEPDGEGWRLTGEKNAVTAGMFADTVVIFVRTSDRPGARGVSAFYVDIDDRWVQRSRIGDLGNRAVGRAVLSFDGYPVTREDMIAGEGDGFVEVMSSFDYNRALLGLQCIGTASAAIDEAIAYSKDRKAFGQTISHYQGVSFPLVDHAIQLHAARLICYEALWRRDAGLRHGIESAMAKVLAPRASVLAIHDALLTLGHVGYSNESAQGMRMLDAMGMEIGDGTANVCRLLIARSMFGRDYV